MARTGANGESRDAEDCVFGEADGSQIKNVKKAWRNACRKAGIGDLRFHDLRHEAAFRMLESGFPLHHVQQMLGHGNVQTTDTYLNVTKLGLKESMRQLDGLRARCNPVANDAAQEPQVVCNDDGNRTPNPQIN